MSGQEVPAWKQQVIGEEISRIRTSLIYAGWALSSGSKLGLDRGKAGSAMGAALEQDPRSMTKLHARDVVSYQRAGSDVLTAEEESIAFTTESGQVIDDFSRVRFLERGGRRVLATVLSLIPEQDVWSAGLMSADYFSYSAGTEVGLHQDKFGRYVAIWCTFRTQDTAGGASLLHSAQGSILNRALAEDELLIFNDGKFTHGFSKLEAGIREALIMIELRKGHG
jgi:hypothetical protein